MTAGEIAGRFEYAWPTITRHLTELRVAGLVECKLAGRERHYRLRREFIQLVREWLAWFDVEPQTTDRMAEAFTSGRATVSTVRSSAKARRARATY